jgi:hypothetical protein
MTRKIGPAILNMMADAGDAAALYTQGVTRLVAATDFHFSIKDDDDYLSRLNEFNNKIARGMKSLTRSASLGHVHAMEYIANHQRDMRHFRLAKECYTRGAELDSPNCMFKLGRSLESGEGGLAIDAVAAAEWYRKAAGSGHADAASNLRFMREVGRGVIRSKQFALQAPRKAAENGKASACVTLAHAMFINQPYARRVGLIDDVVASMVDTFGKANIRDKELLTDMVQSKVSHTLGDLDHVPDDGRVLASVMEWLRRSQINGGGCSSEAFLDMCAKAKNGGDTYCCNAGCEVVARRKEFKVCPQCKFYRYCGPACQTADWQAGGHSRTCCTYQANLDQR